MHFPRNSFESIDLDLGDCIGVESCLDLKSDVAVDSGFRVQKSHGGEGGSSSSDHRGLEKKAIGFPPPIPWLRCAENPVWIMKRYYTNDGRLIIKGEKIKRHEYFQADRSNGRLTVRRVPIIDDELDGDGNNKNGIGFIDNGESNNRNDGYDGESEDELALEEQEQQSRISDHAAAGLYDTENGAAVTGGFVVGVGREKFYRNCSVSRRNWMSGEIGGGVGWQRLDPFIHS